MWVYNVQYKRQYNSTHFLKYFEMFNDAPKQTCWHDTATTPTKYRTIQGTTWPTRIFYSLRGHAQSFLLFTLIPGHLRGLRYHPMLPDARHIYIKPPVPAPPPSPLRNSALTLLSILHASVLHLSSARISVVLCFSWYVSKQVFVVLVIDIRLFFQVWYPLCLAYSSVSLLFLRYVFACNHRAVTGKDKINKQREINLSINQYGSFLGMIFCRP